MSFQKSVIHSNGREWNLITLKKGSATIEVIPEAGFSITSYQWKSEELLDHWDLDTFLGNTQNIEFITNNITDSFRKGFGPSIGPWFNTRDQNSKNWQHGVCRYAEWKNIEIGNNFIKGKLDGSIDTLLGKTLNEICGFKFAVEIQYTLSEEGLEYSVKNLSEGNKGSYGIHWYWKSQPDTKMRLKTDLSQLPQNLTEKRYMMGNGEVLADLNIRNGDIFKAVKEGIASPKGSILYPNGKKINFYYDDIFKITVLFNTKEGCCFEPISEYPHQVGSFTEGIIRMLPSW